MSGEVGNLSPKQSAALEKFRENVKDVTQPEHDDHYLLRWLRARSFDLKKSEDMLRNHLIWRKAEGIDDILQEKFPEVMLKYYPGGHCGFDRDGYPFFLDPIGSIDAKGLLRSTKKMDLIRKEFQNAEYAQVLMKQQTQKLGKRIDRVTLVYDLENFGMRHLWKPGIDTLIKFLQLFEQNYPETMKICLVVNAPRIFPILYNLMRPFLSEETVSKVRVYGTNYKEALLKVIDPDNLPVHYGGSMVDKDGDEKCKSKIVLGGDVPKEYYAQLSSDEMENFTDAIVKRGSSLQVEVDIKKPGGAIRWQFTTEGHDLGFGVYKKTKEEKQSKKQMISVVPTQRVDSHLVPEDGSVAVKEAGIYVVHFDNTYSYLRNKKISYLIEVLESETDDLEAHLFDKTIVKGDKSETCIDSTVENKGNEED